MIHIDERSPEETIAYLEEQILQRIDSIIAGKERQDITSISGRRITVSIGSRPIFNFKLTFTGKGGPEEHEIILKQVKDEFYVKDVFREHHQLAERYHSQNMRAIVPEPYFFIEDGNYLAMGYVRGSSLLKTVLRSLLTRSSASFRDTFTELGSSLAGFHGMYLGDRDPVTFDGLIQETLPLLEDSTNLSDEMRKTLKGHLKRVAEGPWGERPVPISRNYNDWTMRNFLIDDEGTLTLLDTDAMTHPHFNEYNLIWNDVVTFIMNLESQTRYSPLIRRKDIRTLENCFLQGYLAGSAGKVADGEIDDLLFVAAIRIYLSRTRPFRNKFAGRLSKRFLREFETALLNGRGRILG